MAKGLMTLDNVDFNEVWNNFLTPTVDRYNERDRTDFEALLCRRKDEQIVKTMINNTQGFKKEGTITRSDNQYADYGTFQGFLDKIGTGFAYDEEFLMHANLQTIIDTQNDILEQHRTYIRSLILQTCLNNTTDGFFNADFDTGEGITAPPNYGENSFVAGHTHYITSGADTLTLPNCTTCRHHIIQHGVKGSIVGFINSTDEGAITNSLMPTNAGVQVSNPITDKVVVDNVIGVLGGITWIVTESMPSGYVLVVGTNASIGADKPVRLIEPTNTSFRGLRIIEGARPAYPIFGSQYKSHIGGKVFHRGWGVAMQLTAEATYSNPTFLS